MCKAKDGKKGSVGTMNLRLKDKNANKSAMIFKVNTLDAESEYDGYFVDSCDAARGAKSDWVMTTDVAGKAKLNKKTNKQNTSTAKSFAIFKVGEETSNLCC